MSTLSTRHLVDAQLAPLLDLFPTVALSMETLETMRARTLPLPVPPESLGIVDKSVLVLPGPAGAPDLTALLYRPKAATEPLPCIFHIHGGGYVAGSAEAMEGLHRPLVAELGCSLVSVNYRLAPETPFPGAIEDCYAALGWLLSHADELGVDGTRVGVMGESAGGGLAAALALLVRDRNDYSLKFQHLIYPMLDDRTCVTAEHHPYAGEFIWTPVNNTFGWSALLGEPPGGDRVSPYAAAARATNLAGLPPTFISTGALDLFTDENLEYARRLMQSGVPLELHVYPGAFHAFDIAPGAVISEAARQASVAALRRFLHPPP
jgi:triacylglycerol lipase